MKMSAGLQTEQSTDGLLNTFNPKHITQTCWKARILNRVVGVYAPAALQLFEFYKSTDENNILDSTCLSSEVNINFS